ncbi:hypothetical protein VNO78_15136 [Psophocarpus tetragonolobus]|uniref:Uncharacterized protein n=1 Tax=Psophocarpus tetragonolobus TaxID=3891 RepID=A0AAN9XJH4_PSOTE
MTSFEKLSVSSMIPEELEEEKLLENLPLHLQCGSFQNLFGRITNASQLPCLSKLKPLKLIILRGLDFLHTLKKMIRRDFKSSNILLDKCLFFSWLLPCFLTVRLTLYMLKEYVCKLKKLGKEEDANDDKMSSQLEDKSTGCNVNKYGKAFNPDKRKESVQRVSRNVTAIIVLLWMMLEINSQSSKLQLQVLHKQHDHVFIWSSLLEMFGFMVFGWTIAATITAGPPFSRMQSAMLMFWAILMLVRSVKSITEMYVPILGILFTGCYMLVQKQPTH